MSTSTWTFDSLVSRSTTAVRLIGPPPGEGREPSAVSASLNAAISSAVPIETRSQPSGPISRISTPRSSRPCQTACRSAYRPNSTKLASLSATSSPWPASQAAVASRSTRRSSTRASSSSACRSAASAAAWVTALRWYGSRTTRIASQISGAAARYPRRAPANANALLIVRDTTRLRSEGSSSSALGVPGAAELGVRLVDHHHAVARGLAQGQHDVGWERGAGRVVGRRQQHHARPFALEHELTRRIRVEREVALAATLDPAGAGVPRVLGVHRVRRGEADRGPARAAERLQQVQHHLVGPVGRPHLGRRDVVAAVGRSGTPPGPSAGR